ncbi:MAG: hypothetical protein LBG87_06725 [Spirochaetaceae bacterium]|nr:hypothetical protein [Spirochaetaceae bacterium]
MSGKYRLVWLTRSKREKPPPLAAGIRKGEIPTRRAFVREKSQQGGTFAREKSQQDGAFAREKSNKAGHYRKGENPQQGRHYRKGK